VTYPLPCLLPNQSSFSSAPGHSIRRSPSWSAPRYWTKGGTLRSFPVGGGTRKKPSSSSELPRRLRRGRTPRAPAAARVRPLRLTLRRLPTADILLRRPPSTPLRRDARARGHGSEGSYSARRRQGAPAAHGVRLVRPGLSLPSCAGPPEPGTRAPPRDIADAHPTAEDPSTASAPTCSSIMYVLASVRAC